MGMACPKSPRLVVQTRDQIKRRRCAAPGPALPRAGLWPARRARAVLAEQLPQISNANPADRADGTGPCSWRSIVQLADTDR